MGKQLFGNKITIIGAGLVGSTTAYALMNGGTASEIVLIDLDEKRLKGEVMDLNHGISFVPPTKIRAGTYEDCKDSNVVIIAAGIARKPGQSRMDLMRKNVEIFKSIVPKIVEQNEECIILVVTNPVDVLTYATWKISGLPSNQIIGSGTLLDSSRFKFLLGEHCNIAPQNIHAYIIGEHGDSEVAAWSITNIAGMPFNEYCTRCSDACSRGERRKIFENIKGAGHSIIEGKGATYYAIALAVRRIVEAILRDENAILPVSSLMRGYYGLEDICLSLPTVVNRNGISQVLELSLADEEIEGIISSASALKAAIKEAGL